MKQPHLPGTGTQRNPRVGGAAGSQRTMARRLLFLPAWGGVWETQGNVEQSAPSLHPMCTDPHPPAGAHPSGLVARHTERVPSQREWQRPSPSLSHSAGSVWVRLESACSEPLLPGPADSPAFVIDRVFQNLPAPKLARLALLPLLPGVFQPLHFWDGRSFSGRRASWRTHGVALQKS